MIHTITFMPFLHNENDYGVSSYIDDRLVTRLIQECEIKQDANVSSGSDESLTVQKARDIICGHHAFPYNLLYRINPVTVADLPLNDRHDALLLACGCGEWGCSSVTVRMQVTNSQVHWHNIQTPYHNRKIYANLDRLTFDREQYRSACIDIHKHHRSILREKYTQILLPHEETHLLDGIQSNRENLELLFHESYSEIDSTGRTYSRDQVLELLPIALVSKREIHNFQASPLDPVDPTNELIQTTYTLTLTDQDNCKHPSRRSSIWTRTSHLSNWQLMFHQCTPA